MQYTVYGIIILCILGYIYNSDTRNSKTEKTLAFWENPY